MKKRRIGVVLAMTVLLGVMTPQTVEAAENIVIAIDPGHGGVGDRNMGAVILGEAGAASYIEKLMTMETALAMKAELEKYEGVTVLLTRTQDVITGLAERAQTAKAGGADFLVSLHYNASVEKNFYGTEVWTQSAGSLYQQGASAGNLFLTELTGQLQTYNRGVKVKLGEDGTDYYGILRESGNRNIPAILVEHCYVDNAVDRESMDTKEDMLAIGKADATALAKYFGLRSTQLGVDYKNHPKLTLEAPATRKSQDVTPPEISNLQVLTSDIPNKQITLRVDAKDVESQILYFNYTLDGGVTWVPLHRWDRTTTNMTMTLPATPGQGNVLAIRVYNGYDLMTQSAPMLY